MEREEASRVSRCGSDNNWVRQRDIYEGNKDLLAANDFIRYWMARS